MKFLEILIGALMAAIVVGIAMLVVTPGLILWSFTLKNLWGWFVVPLGAPAINAWHAYGLMLIGSVFTHGLSRYDKNGEDDEAAEKMAKLLVSSILSSLLVWGIGAWVHGHI